VGINTVIKDNPRLDGLKKMPFKVVLDPRLRIPLNSFLIKDSPHKLIIFTAHKNKEKLKRIPTGVKIFFVEEKRKGLPLKKVLKILYKLGIMSVFIEGGSTTLGKFFDEKLIDKIYFFIAPKIIGGKKSLTSIGGSGADSPTNSPYIKELSFTKLGEDILISGYLHYGKK
jgi:diaminohydroxyphosphoribosylaminopyrimidine deaminase/5-amino-6-(5-phosphoribosylamino)uracil reductase